MFVWTLTKFNSFTNRKCKHTREKHMGHKGINTQYHVFVLFLSQFTNQIDRYIIEKLSNIVTITSATIHRHSRKRHYVLLITTLLWRIWSIVYIFQCTCAPVFVFIQLIIQALHASVAGQCEPIEECKMYGNCCCTALPNNSASRGRHRLLRF